MKTAPICTVLLLTMLFSPVTSQAKGKTIQLSISGPGLDLPIHTDDYDLIDANPWGNGGFLDKKAGVIAPAARYLSDYYRVHFWIELPNGDVRIMYMVRFRWDEDAGRGVVCLTPRDNPWSTLNTSTIWLGDLEGQCLY